MELLEGILSELKCYKVLVIFGLVPIEWRLLKFLTFGDKFDQAISYRTGWTISKYNYIANYSLNVINTYTGANYKLYKYTHDIHVHMESTLL